MNDSLEEKVMDRRKLVAGLMVLAASMLMLAGTASAHNAVVPAGAAPTAPAECKITSLPSFVAQGEFETNATVADVIEVSCNPEQYSAGAEVTIVAAQLYSRCHELTWYDANDQGYGYKTGSGPSFQVHLDVDGNANVALIAGPNCMVGESLISVDENEPPFNTFTSAFKVLPAVDTTPGLYLTPSEQVEDAYSSGVITIAQAEFKEASEAYVRLGYEQLADRCQNDPGARLINEHRYEYVGNEETTRAIQLDNNGNGFALLVGDSSCASGPSLIEADLEQAPFTTFASDFTTLSPRVR
jgi:hypothetical protein